MKKKRNENFMLLIFAIIFIAIIALILLLACNEALRRSNFMLQETSKKCNISDYQQFERTIPSHEEILELETYTYPEEPEEASGACDLKKSLKIAGFTEEQAYNIIGWMQGEADYSEDMLLGYYSANAIMNTIINGIDPADWGEYYSLKSMMYRTDELPIRESTKECIKEALRHRDYSIRGCYGIYLGSSEGEPIYVSDAVLSEGEPVGVWCY